MPAGVDVFVDEGFATIDVPDPGLRATVLNKILQVTPAALVETLTRSGANKQYRIPEGNARRAGLVDGEATDNPPADRKDLHFADELVAADPRAQTGRGGHGEFRSPMHAGTVKDQAYGAAPTGVNTVTQSQVNNPHPIEANGHITGPLRPNQPVADYVPSPPAIASESPADLQVRIRENTPNPADYAPTHVPADERVPLAQGTIASVVDRGPRGPSEPASGVSTGPNAGRLHIEEQAHVAQATGEPNIAIKAEVGETVELKPLDDYTVPELRKIAKDNDVDLTGVSKKADIVKALKKGRKS